MPADDATLDVPSDVCSFCGQPAQGNYSIHRDGFCEGPEVPLCDACGSDTHPTCIEIWERISQTHKPL